MATPANTDPIALDDETLLSIETLIKRPVIAIDGTKYEILSPNELSILDSYKFGIWGRRIDALAREEGEDAEKALEEMVAKVARKIAVGVPDEVFEQLTGSHKFAINDVFTGLLMRDRLGVAGAIAKAAGVPLTGELSSLVSSASTAVAPSGGWQKRLSRWFGLS